MSCLWVCESHNKLQGVGQKNPEEGRICEAGAGSPHLLPLPVLWRVGVPAAALS